MPGVTLRPFPLADVRGLVAGSADRRADWAAEFPSSDTIHGLALIVAAYEALGVDLVREPAWWVHQIEVSGAEGGPGTVVGEAGFHGPPDPDGAVELGYEVVPGWRNRGVATRACGLLLIQAWALGARVVRAEAAPDNVGSRRVLQANGFRPGPDSRGPDAFQVHRP